MCTDETEQTDSCNEFHFGNILMNSSTFLFPGYEVSLVVIVPHPTPISIALTPLTTSFPTHTLSVGLENVQNSEW